MPPMASTVETGTPTSVGMNRLAKYGLFAVIAASGTNAIVGVVALAVFDIPAGFGGLGWGSIIASSALGAVVATGVYGLIARYSTRPNRTFIIIAAVALVLSYIPFLQPPPTLAGASQSVFVTLGVMHVTAAVVIVGVLTQATSAEVQ
jgi:hypothetical protein